MPSRSSGPVNRPVVMSICLMLACVGVAVIAAADAKAGYYKMVGCAASSGAPPYSTGTNTTSPQNPGGIFNFSNFCTGQGGDPPGEHSMLRIVENQASGNAGHGAYGHIVFDTPPWIHFKSAGGYTRQPASFNDGWRSRFWVASSCCTTQIMTQGAGLPNSGGQWGTTGSFAPHLWPHPTLWDFNRFVFEQQCVRPAGCDRSGYNGTDLNGIVFILSDDSDSQVGFTNTGSALMQGQWVRGTQNITFNVADAGSGLRHERLRVDGAQRWGWDHGPECNTSSSQVNGEWARTYRPCPTGGPYGRVYALDTATLADGPHTIQVCTQDYGQYQGLGGTGGETCDQRTIRVDNTVPGAPSGLHVTSTNPARYLDRFGATFSLPPNQGSPIAKVHYNVVNAAGEVVKPLQTLTATNPTALTAIEGPKAPGDYSLRVWLEDQVGHVGPASTAEIPRDTVPPAAPQDVAVASPVTPKAQDGFDLRWRNVLDAGAPIDAARYQVLNASGAVVVPTQTVRDDLVQRIEDIETPSDRGAFTLRLWLADAEGNVGAPVSVPLAYECVRSTLGGAQQLSAELAGGPLEVVEQGQGATLRGELRGAGGDIAGAPLCIFSRIDGEEARQFLGIAITGSRGDFRFAIAPGPSRTLSAVHRPGQRQLSADATLQTLVKPTLRARKLVVRTGEFARLSGEIPGPRNDDVVIVLQVRQGNGWLAFRRYKTRSGGQFQATYLFRRTIRPTTYEMRAQVREASGYPYLEGDSDPVFLRVLPKRRAGSRCPADKRTVKRRGRARCERSRARGGQPARCSRVKAGAMETPKRAFAATSHRGARQCSPAQLTTHTHDVSARGQLRIRHSSKEAKWRRVSPIQERGRAVG
jgi:hypothetical protein